MELHDYTCSIEPIDLLELEHPSMPDDEHLQKWGLRLWPRYRKCLPFLTRDESNELWNHCQRLEETVRQQPGTDLAKEARHRVTEFIRRQFEISAC